MKNSRYTRPFEINTSPEWNCPRCGKALLGIKWDTFHYFETADSRNDHKPDECEPQGTYIFSCILECTNANCGEFIACSGRGAYEDVQIGETEYDHQLRFYPQYFSSSLKLVETPPKTPVAVAVEVEKACGLYFLAPSASLNHIRKALENILDSKGVEKDGVRKEPRCDGKNRRLNLHERIQLSMLDDGDGLKDKLMATKWLGNAGSHSEDNVTSNDVDDALVLMKSVLNSLYNENEAVKKLAQDINSRKGPRK